MRNALLLLLVSFVVSGFFTAGVCAADVVSGSIFLGPAVSNGSSPLDDDRRLLPIRGSSLPGSGSLDNGGLSHDVPQASIIEAIPTPTAFNTGALLISVIIAGRYFRKLRSRFVAA